MPKKITRIFSFLLCFVLIFQQIGFSQIAGELDISRHFQHLGGLFSQDTFRPLHLRYLSYDSLSNNFNLLLDKGDQKGTFPKGTPFETQLKEESNKLLNYFFVGVSLPNDKFWVNLRPDSPNNIIDDELAKTDIGRIFLETDLQLKKDTANYTSPNTPEGREYWDKLYKKAEELYGYDNVTIPTLTRPWIVPGEIIIRETKGLSPQGTVPELPSAYIYKATLKVMLEQDYLKDSTTYAFKDERSKALNEYSSQLIRELIIPKLTKEINSSKRYAPLRQVYYSLILAQWFKQKFKQGLSPKGTVPSLIDSQNLSNLASKEDWSKTTYFNAYKQSFAEGEYNIKEPVYAPTGQVIRSYFSGGIKIDNMSPTFLNIAGSPVGNKPYLEPMRLENSALLAGSPVLSQQKIEALNKELAFYMIVGHDLGNFAQGFGSAIRNRMVKGEIDKNSIDLEKFSALVRKNIELTRDAETERMNPGRLSEVLVGLREVNKQLDKELHALQPLLSGDLTERLNLLMAIVNPELPYSIIDLREALEWVSNWHKNAYGFKINFLADLKADKSPFLGNKYHLKRIIGNLLSNSETAFINNHIDWNKRLAEITLALKENSYVITYKDTAGGIPAELLGKIFEPRFTTKNREDNPLSGFGMVITKEFIEKMGGTITVQSELGKGTTFTITLPASSSSPSDSGNDFKEISLVGLDRDNNFHSAEAVGSPELVVPAIKGYRPMSAEKTKIRIGLGQANIEMLEGLPRVQWEETAQIQINSFLEYYSGIIKDVRLYSDRKDFIVLFLLPDESSSIEEFINDPVKFNQNLIVHLNRLIKYLSETRHINANKENKRLFTESQMALFWNIMEALTKYSPNVNRVFFDNTVDQYIGELNKSHSDRIPQKYKPNKLFKDYIGAYSYVYDTEVSRICRFLDKAKHNRKDMSVDIYDLGAWAGLFAPVIASWLDDWAKRNGVILRADFHIVDPDLNAFEKLGGSKYEQCKELYSAATGRKSGLVFDYNTYALKAQDVQYKDNAIVVANDFYEHIEGFRKQIVAKMSAQNKISMQFVHVPYEEVPDRSWGHVNSFNQATLINSFSQFSSAGYGMEVINDPGDNGGFLIIEKQDQGAKQRDAFASPLKPLRNDNKESVTMVTGRLKLEMPQRKIAIWDYNKSIVEFIDIWQLVNLMKERRQRRFYNQEQINEAVRIERLSDEEFAMEASGFLKEYGYIPREESLQWLLNEMSANFWKFYEYLINKAIVLAPSYLKDSLGAPVTEELLNNANNVVKYNQLLEEIVYRWNLSDTTSSSPDSADPARPGSSPLPPKEAVVASSTEDGKLSDLSESKPEEAFIPRKYCNLENGSFISRYKRIVEEEKGEEANPSDLKELNRFSQIIPELLKLKYLRNCRNSAPKVFELLRENNIPVSMREIRFYEYDSDVVAHVYCVVILGSVKFILDLTVEQYDVRQARKQGKEFMGIVLFPARFAFEQKEKFEMYFLSQDYFGPTYNDTGIDEKGRHVGYKIMYGKGGPTEIIAVGIDDAFSAALEDIDPRVAKMASERIEDDRHLFAATSSPTAAGPAKPVSSPLKQNQPNIEYAFKGNDTFVDVAKVAQWYKDMFVDSFGEDYVDDGENDLYRFLMSAANLTQENMQEELGEFWDGKYYLGLSKMSTSQMLDEYKEHLKPDRYVHEESRLGLLDIVSPYFCGHLYNRTKTAIEDWKDLEENTELRELMVRERGQEYVDSFRQKSELAKKKMLFFHQWIYRHWDSAEKKRLHLIVDLSKINNTTATSSPAAFNPAKPGSSPMQESQDDLGGIDMRHLAKNTIVENRDSPLRGQSLFSEPSSGVESEELREVQRLIRAGIIPSIKRLQECRNSCSAEDLLSCVADILRMEEERAAATEPDLKNLLVMIGKNG